MEGLILGTLAMIFMPSATYFLCNYLDTTKNFNPFVVILYFASCLIICIWTIGNVSIEMSPRSNIFFTIVFSVVSACGVTMYNTMEKWLEQTHAL